MNKKNRNKETPLFTACENGNEPLVKYLVELGANINKENDYGQNPLFIACKYGNKKVEKYLEKRRENIKWE